MSVERKSLRGQLSEGERKLDKRYIASRVAISNAAVIVHQLNYKPKPPTVCKLKRHNAMSAGFCTICQESFSSLTKLHAEKHGFESREEMVAAGVIRYE